MYDYIIIGGGISGIYTSLLLSKSNNVLLLDDREYWGGRINTNIEPKYEIGAARFSNKHIILNKLINKYKLKKVKLNNNIDYIDKNSCRLIRNVNKVIDKYFELLIEKAEQFEKTTLINMSLYEFMRTFNTKEQCDSIINMFGYYSEIKMTNAYDALNNFKLDFVNRNYYVLESGLSELIMCMIRDMNNNGGICKNNEKVTDVIDCDNHFNVKTLKNEYNSKKIVFAIKGYQIKEFNLLRPIHYLCKSIYSSELLRIYAIYDNIWFSNIRRTTTNSFLRQIIPIDYEKGLIMVSYTDGKDVNIFKKNNKLMSDSKIKSIITKELRRLFGDVPFPKYFKVHYWKMGAHHWKPKNNSDEISNIVLNPLNKVYICGESYSKKQAWIEGALETSEQIVSIAKTNK